jgi:hypothetical protein
MMSPTIPTQLLSTNAAIETLRPIQLFIFRFVEESVKITKEAAGVAWEYSQPVLQNVSETATSYALGAVRASIEIIQRRGGETYTFINDAIVDFVETDIEEQEQEQQQQQQQQQQQSGQQQQLGQGVPLNTIQIFSPSDDSSLRPGANTDSVVEASIDGTVGPSSDDDAKGGAHTRAPNRAEDTTTTTTTNANATNADEYSAYDAYSAANNASLESSSTAVDVLVM